MVISETFKKALLSIVIGASVSFLTVLFQGLLDFVKHAGPAVPGIAVAVYHNLITWKTNPTV